MTLEQFRKHPVEQQTVEQFKLVDETELKKFFSMAMHAANNYQLSLDHIMYAVVMAEKKGIFNNVKFGCEVYKEPTY